VFRQPLFMRGKRSLLRFIARNQKKGAKEDSTGQNREEKKETKLRYTSELIQEIDKIKQQQLGLESMLLELDHKNEESDLSTQMMMSRFYHKYKLRVIMVREMQNNMGMFALFILSQYLNRQNNEVELLGTLILQSLIGMDQIMTINRNVKMWIGDNVPATECHFVHQVVFTFNIALEPTKCKQKKALLSKLNVDFINWLKEFIKKNNINFPYVETFFTVLIASTLKDTTLSEEVTPEMQNKCILNAQSSIESLFEKKLTRDGHSQSIDGVDASSYTEKSIFEIKGTITFEPMQETDYYANYAEPVVDQAKAG